MNYNQKEDFIENFIEKIFSFGSFYILLMILNIPSLTISNFNLPKYVMHILFFLYLVMFCLIVRMLRNIGDTSNKKKKLNLKVGITLLLSIIVILLLGYVGDWLQGVYPVELPSNQIYIEKQMERYPIIIIFQVLLQGPIIEELIFRKIFFQKFFINCSRKKMTLGVLVNSFIFALVHYSHLDFSFLVYFIMGINFNYIYIYTKDIRYSMIIHFINNFLALIP